MGAIMSTAAGLASALRDTHTYFSRTLSVFEPEHERFAPKPDLYTVAGHVAHTAHTVDWFIEGAFGEGWDMDFEGLIAQARAVTSLTEATAWLDRAFANAVAVVGGASDEALFEFISDTRIMEGERRIAVVSGIVDHTAHHRGSLAVYARLVGKTPPMYYAEIPE
jgi:uncharacterized damage-inducible protein DinB